MAFVTLFVPEEFLNNPTHGSIQYHPSLLPAYRGASAINWPIIKGEKETGLSIFWPDNGLDTGDVLLQKKTPISDTDTLGTVYFDRLFPMGVDAMMEAVDLVKRSAFAKFDETVDVAVNLGVDPRHADQVVSGTVVLPHGTGKSVRVLVIATGGRAREAGRTPGPDLKRRRERLKGGGQGGPLRRRLGPHRSPRPAPL